MPAPAGEDDLDPGHPGDRRDDAQRRALRRERRPLLDVRLDEARGRTVEDRLRGQVLPQPERRERLAERDPVGVDEIGLVGLELAEERPRAEHSAAEPWALLQPERDDGDRPPGTARRLDRRGGLERRDDAERAVEAPAVGRRVEVGAAPDLGQRRIGPRRAPPQVPRAIDRHGEPRLVHPAGDEVVGALLALTEAGPVGACVAADLEQRVEALDDPAGGLEPAWRELDHARTLRGSPCSTLLDV